jgi:hypothetical protein
MNHENRTKNKAKQTAASKVTNMSFDLLKTLTSLRNTHRLVGLEIVDI